MGAERKSPGMKHLKLFHRDVLTVRSDTPVSAIAKLLLEQRISAVPVVDDKGQLLGITSEGDLLHREELGTERRAAGGSTSSSTTCGSPTSTCARTASRPTT